MLHVLWIFLISFIVLMVELWATKFSLLIPGGFFIAFYAGLSYGRNRGLLCGVLVCATVETILGRQVSSIILFLPLVIYISWYHRLGDRNSIFFQALSGFWLGLVYNLFLFLVQYPSPALLYHFSFRILTTCIAGAVGTALLFPIGIAIFDNISKSADLKLFCKSREHVYLR